MFRKSTQKYIAFSISIEKEVTRIGKNDEEVTKTICCRLQLLDSVRFMKSSSSNLVNNLAEEIHEIKGKYGHENKKCETCRI